MATVVLSRRLWCHSGQELALGALRPTLEQLERDRVAVSDTIARAISKAYPGCNPHHQRCMLTGASLHRALEQLFSGFGQTWRGRYAQAALHTLVAEEER